jgi:diamine N-acetyltransferase
VISSGLRDRLGRTVTLRPIGDDWRAVADVAPTDEQRLFVHPLAARYMLTSERGGPWTSLGAYADEEVVGHVMWAIDDDGSHWIGGLLIDATEQGRGLGRAVTQTLVDWFQQQDGHWASRLSYHPENPVAAGLYASLGFVPTGVVDDDGEIVAELRKG